MELVVSHPTMLVKAELLGTFLDSAKDVLWPSNAGPMEQMFSLADFATWFGGPIVMSVTMIAGFLGYSFRELGKWIDKELNLHSWADLKNLNVQSALNSLLGSMSPETMTQIQSDGSELGLVQSVKTASLLSKKEIIKKAEVTENVHKMLEQDAAKQMRKEIESDKGVLKATERKEKLMQKLNQKGDHKFSNRELRRIDVANDNILKQKRLATEAAEVRRSGMLKQYMGKSGERLKTLKHVGRNRGVVGTIFTAFATTLGYFKDLAAKFIGLGPIKNIPKKGKIGFLWKIFKMVLSGVAAFSIFNFAKNSISPVKDSEITKNKELYSANTNKTLSEQAQKKGLISSPLPSSFEGKVAQQIDLAIKGFRL